MIGTIIKKIIAYILSLIVTLSGIAGARLSPAPSTEGEIVSEKLYNAINAQNEQALIEAIEEGADINKLQYTKSGTISPLVFAMHTLNSDRMIKKILEYGIDPDVVDTSGATVLCEIIDSDGYYDRYIFDDLLSRNPDLNYVCSNGLSAVDCAVFDGDFQMLRAILDRGAVVTTKNIKHVISYVKGPLKEMHIIYKDDIVYYSRMLGELINNYDGNDIDKNLYDAYRGTFSSDNKCKNDWVLYGIAGYCSSETLSRYIDDKSDIALLFRIAAAAGNIDNMKYLAERGADLRFSQENDYFNALRYSVTYDNIEATKYILTLNQEDIDECVYIATRNKNLNMIKLLYECKPNNKNSKAFTVALSCNYTEALRYFIENGFDVNTVDVISSRIVSACGYCNLDMIKFMQQHGGIINNDNILEAIDRAVFMGNTEVLQYLIDMGADPNGTYKYKNSPIIEDSPLFVSVRDGRYDIVQLLVENGATSDCLSIEDYSALVEKAEKSNTIYEYLKSKGILNR